jgi:DNA mismatch endonuclease (patch repair protein)
MSIIKNKDTKPEITVRRLVHGMGFRYRLHYAKLPGRPDIVFPGRRKLIFVHGCFWHRHSDPTCKKGRLPESRREFWGPKLNGNRARDERVTAELRREGWAVMTVWECQCRRPDDLKVALGHFLTESSEAKQKSG